MVALRAQHNGIQHNYTQHNGLVCDTRHEWQSVYLTLSIAMLCIMLNVVMLSVIMLSVIMLSVVMLNVVMLNVRPPVLSVGHFKYLTKNAPFRYGTINKTTIIIIYFEV